MSIRNGKKWMMTAALLMALSMGLCACGNEKAPEATATPAAETVTEAPATEAPAAESAVETVTEAAVKAETAVKDLLKSTEGITEFPGAVICELTGLEEDDYTEITYFESADGVSARCVIVMTGKDGNAADKAEAALKKYLEQRMKETQNYLPDEYKLLSAAKVDRKDNTVVLIVGSDAAEETRLVLQSR